MVKFTKKRFTVYPGKASTETACFSKAETCKNYGSQRCADCVRVQGKFTGYEESKKQTKGDC